MKLACVILVAFLLPAANALKVQTKHQTVTRGHGNKSSDTGLSEKTMLLDIMWTVLTDLGLGSALNGYILNKDSEKTQLMKINEKLVEDSGLGAELCYHISSGVTDPTDLLLLLADFFIGELSLDEEMLDFIEHEEEEYIEEQEYLEEHPLFMGGEGEYLKERVATKTVAHKRKSTEEFVVDPELILEKTGVQFWTDRGLISQLNGLVIAMGSWCDGKSTLVELAEKVIDDMGLGTELASLGSSGADKLLDLIDWLIQSSSIDDKMKDIFKTIYPNEKSWWDEKEA